MWKRFEDMKWNKELHEMEAQQIVFDRWEALLLIKTIGIKILHSYSYQSTLGFGTSWTFPQMIIYIDDVYSHPLSLSL